MLLTTVENPTSCYAAFGVGALAAIALEWHGFGWRTGISWIRLEPH